MVWRAKPKTRLAKTRLAAVTLAALISAFSAGCASVATDLPDIAPAALAGESLRQETTALTQLRARADRLMAVAQPILTANAELCPKVRPDIGVMMHSEANYSKELRGGARRVLSAGERDSIFALAPGGPGEAAGLMAGDIILIDNEPVRPTDKALKAHLAAPDPVLIIERKGRTMEIPVQPVQACDMKLRVKASSAINAYADGRSITVTTGMMDFAQDDDELALIIGHELAHNTMGHIRKVIGNLILSGLATRYTRPFESEADYVGLYYQVRAGYDPSNVEGFWRRLAAVNPRSVKRAKTHPTFPDRYLRLQAARDEIRAKQEAGVPLLPNFKSRS